MHITQIGVFRSINRSTDRLNRLMNKVVIAALLSAGWVAPVYAGPEDEPTGAEMMVDAAIARPIGLITTVLGAAAFVVTLPFSALGGNVDKAADALVLDPGRETFVRCLGCRRSGRPDRFRGEDEFE